ncbi:MAG: class II aldolase/adducin family protein [Geminicoccaceae bacterium]
MKFKVDIEQRKDIIATALKMNEVGINHGSSGNVSVRHGDGILITPSGMAYDTIQPADIVKVFWDGSYDGRRLPSSEWRFHLDIMRAREDVDAVIHTHATACTTLACLRMDIPAFHYMIAVAGGQ